MWYLELSLSVILVVVVVTPVGLNASLFQFETGDMEQV